MILFRVFLLFLVSISMKKLKIELKKSYFLHFFFRNLVGNACRNWKPPIMVLIFPFWIVLKTLMVVLYCGKVISPWLLLLLTRILTQYICSNFFYDVLYKPLRKPPWNYFVKMFAQNYIHLNYNWRKRQSSVVLKDFLCAISVLSLSILYAIGFLSFKIYYFLTISILKT